MHTPLKKVTSPKWKNHHLTNILIHSKSRYCKVPTKKSKKNPRFPKRLFLFLFLRRESWRKRNPFPFFFFSALPQKSCKPR